MPRVTAIAARSCHACATPAPRGTLRPWAESARTHGSPGSRSVGVLLVVVLRRLAAGHARRTSTCCSRTTRTRPMPSSASAARSPRSSRDGSGIYYLDVLVHRASLPESWLVALRGRRHRRARRRRSCRRAAARATSTASTTSTFQDSRTVAGVVALRALGRKVTVEQTGVTFDGVEHSRRPRMRRTAPRHGDHGHRRRPGAAGRGAAHAARRAASRARPIQLTVRDGSKHARAAHAADDATRRPPDHAIIGVLGVHDAPPKAQLPVQRHDHAARPRPRPLGRARLHARGLRRAQRSPPRERAARSPSPARSTSTARSAPSAACVRRCIGAVRTARRPGPRPRGERRRRPRRRAGARQGGRRRHLPPGADRARRIRRRRREPLRASRSLRGFRVANRWIGSAGPARVSRVDEATDDHLRRLLLPARALVRSAAGCTLSDLPAREPRRARSARRRRRSYRCPMRSNTRAAQWSARTSNL